MDKKQTIPMILIVDDKSENLQYLNKILSNDYNVRATLDANMAMEFLKNNTPDLILLDIKMPNIDGYSLCNKLKQYGHLKDTPVIFISALEDIDSKIKAFENGGVDYITKPFEAKEVLARIKTQIDIFQSKKTIKQLLNQQDMFIKKIMHEMNTPLSVISLNTESIERECGASDEIYAIKASTKTLSSIYSDLSFLVKKEYPEYKKTDIDFVSFLSKRISFFDELANVKNIDINFEIESHITININEYELERIVDNTISNAIKYSNESSIIDILLLKENEKYQFVVEDQGIGIEDEKSIFTPFYQQSNQNHGLGLGLTIVKELCDKNSIAIDVKSEKNVGTRFTYDITTISKEL